MALPDGKMRELLTRWSNGNKQAAEFMMNLAAITRLADNIADGDSENIVSDMADLLYRTTITLQLDPFYTENKIALFPVMANAILAWKVSEKWRKSEDGKARMFAYIYRELVEQVMWTTAVLTGGMDHAMSVVEDLFKESHSNSGETFEDWLKGD